MNTDGFVEANKAPGAMEGQKAMQRVCQHCGKRLSHLQAEGGLAHGLVFRQHELGGLVGVFGGEAFASARLGIDAVEGASAQSTLNEPEPVFHNLMSVPGNEAIA
jgi:hypothetical protein